jgi:tetratricopeptide (TPR) repeat protein
MEKKNFEEALTLFAEAQRYCPDNREIVFYKTSALAGRYRQVAERMRGQVPSQLQTMKAEYDVAIKRHRHDHFLHFYRGLIELFAHDYVSALNDLDKAVRSSDEPNAKYHMYKALTYACMSMFKEALKDFSIAIKMKDDYLLAYYNRGKCAYLLGNTDLAFMDFQRLIVLTPVLLSPISFTFLFI